MLMTVATYMPVLLRIYLPQYIDALGVLFDMPSLETIELSNVKKHAILSHARATAKSRTSHKGPQTHRKPLASPAVTQRRRLFPAVTRRPPLLSAATHSPRSASGENHDFGGFPAPFRLSHSSGWDSRFC